MTTDNHTATAHKIAAKAVQKLRDLHAPALVPTVILGDAADEIYAARVVAHQAAQKAEVLTILAALEMRTNVDDSAIPKLAQAIKAEVAFIFGRATATEELEEQVSEIVSSCMASL